MAKAYSDDLRRKILEAYARGEGTKAQLAERFRVSLGFVKKIRRQQLRTGEMERPAYRAQPWAQHLILSSATAVHYCLAALQDEKNGFSFTAAMEWRKAAELFAPIALMSHRCWHEWERIMHLPRHLAAPIGVLNAAQDSSSTPNIEAVTVTALNEHPLVAAAYGLELWAGAL